MAWRIIHMLGSLTLALILLATIAIACAAATFAESSFTTKVAQTYIYKAPWFLVWLGVLCVNLFAVTLTRWPWQKKHIGFVVTHFGIITLLIGAIVGSRTGFEGNVTLQTDQPPVSRVTTSRSILQLESPTDLAQYLTDFDAEATHPSEKRPKVFPVPDTDLSIVADDFSANLLQEQHLVSSEVPDAAPAVLLKFSSAMVGQSLAMPLILTGGEPAEQDFFGLARVKFSTALPEAKSATEPETQVVFAKFAPVVQPGETPSGLTVRLSEDGEKVTVANASGVGVTYLRKEIMGQTLEENGTLIVAEDYWPDFAMNAGRPMTKSDQPNNPALLVRMTKPKTVSDAKPVLELAPAADGVAYQLWRGGSVTASGTAKVGESFALGWADWQAKVEQALPRAVSVTTAKPGPELPKGERGVPGFRAHLDSKTDGRGPDQWVQSGDITSLTDGKNVVRIGYGLETRAVPFSIRLLKFDVPRDEGTDAPSNFLATVEFRAATDGAISTGVAQMNRPASWPGTLWANLTGINYKFSQAEWNPQNLKETTLQVLYDPGWMLKWIGSLGICVGIAIMFYWKPK